MPQAVLDTLPQDSIVQDSIVQDTVEPYYAPQYTDGFPSEQWAASDTVVMEDINSLPVMEQPPRVPAGKLVKSPLHDTPSMALLLAGVLLVVVSYRTGYKYFENLFHNIFSTRRRENLFEDHTVNETQVLAALITNTCIVEGLLIYCAVQWFVPQLAASLHSHVTLHVLAFVGLAAVFYILQWLGYNLLGYVFSDKVGSKLLIDGFNASQSLLGLVLLPVLMIALLYPIHAPTMLWVAAGCYAVARIFFICKGFRIFYSNLSSIVYFILYLCAVEIVPLVVMTGVTLWICDILQS